MKLEARAEGHKKEDAAPKMLGGGDHDAAMVMEDGHEDGDNKNENNPAAKEDEETLKQDLDKAVQAWRDLVGAHKITLELAANLCKNGDGDEEAGEEHQIKDNGRM